MIGAENEAAAIRAQQAKANRGKGTPTYTVLDLDDDVSQVAEQARQRALAAARGDT
ncbi:MAG: hypothetical protein AB7R89_16205 [Dehalococcoidia bacterium]